MAEMKERLYEVICAAVKPFPRERLDWIDWLMALTGYVVAVMNSLGASETKADEAPRAEAVRRIVALLYEDARGSTPWGGSLVGGAEGAITRFGVHWAKMQERGVLAMERAARALEKSAPERDEVDSDVLDLARRVLEDLQAIGIRAGALVPYDRAVANAEELARRLGADVRITADGFTAVELLDHLRQLPESQRLAFATFEGLSSATYQALCNFWAENPV